MAQNKKLLIGIVIYNSAKYLPYFLPSLFAQDYADFDLIAADNSESEDNEGALYVKTKYPDVRIEWMKGNIGFARAYNCLIDIAAERGYEYFMVVNVDILFEKDAISKLVAGLDADKGISSVCPKIRCWDFENNAKTEKLDSCGIIMPKPLRFADFAQGEADTGQCGTREIIGPSGAAGIFRLGALQKTKDEHGYFDSRMFMYKEDCDLAYRIHRMGFRSRCICDAVVYHDRTASANGTSNWKIFLNRRNKNRKVKEWSFVNQQLIFCKHWKGLNFFEKSSIAIYQFKVLIYVLFFEPYLMVELLKSRKSMK